MYNGGLNISQQWRKSASILSIHKGIYMVCLNKDNIDVMCPLRKTDYSKQETTL